MNSPIYPVSALRKKIYEAVDKNLLAEEKWISNLIAKDKGEGSDIKSDSIDKLLSALGDSEKRSWHLFRTFWPPRCVAAFREKKAVVFFGAGISISSGVPSWGSLLNDNFNLNRELIDDKDLQTDPLTLAELASEYIGSESLQKTLRDVFDKSRPFSINHLNLVAFNCKAYITTNYDTLFEDAWKHLYGKEIKVVTNDADLSDSGEATLYKIHGSVKRESEHMILTRRDYRTHYRSNPNLFNRVRELINKNHTLFVGFSHKDPEVSRLVEDVIHEYEMQTLESHHYQERPHFYSLQFDMRRHTPEIFAAQGIVALNPPRLIAQDQDEDIKTKSLAFALMELNQATEENLHDEIKLDDKLQEVTKQLSQNIVDALKKIGKYEDPAEALIRGQSDNESWLATLCSELGGLASQGVYLLNNLGKIVAYHVPSGLASRGSLKGRDLSERPYFQQANSFRKAFVSDSAESIFNGQSTIFLCKPFLDENFNDSRISGMLFAAAQIGEGQWALPLEIAEEIWLDSKKISFLIIDSNGVCLIPPRHELKTELPQGKWQTRTNNEEKTANAAFAYYDLLHLSRRDRLVNHIGENVIPLTQDDDLLPFTENYAQYTVVGQLIPGNEYINRIKIGLSIPVDIKK